MARPFVILLAVASLVYLFLIPRYHVGTAFNDDGTYVLAAQSLAHGHYVQLHLPDHPPISLYPPGFPLLLAPFTVLAGSHLALLKGVSFILTLLSLYLLGTLLKGWLSPGFLLLGLAAYALNPTTAVFAGLLMSEPCYFFALLLTFVWMKRLARQDSQKGAWALGLLLGWIALIRTEGLVIFPAVAIGLAYTRRWKTLSIALSLGLFIAGAYYLYTAFLSTGPSIYHRGWNLVFEEIHRDPLVLFRNIRNGLHCLILQYGVSPRIPQNAVGTVPLILMTLAGGLGATFGFRAYWKEQVSARPMLAVLAAYLLLSLTLHTFWLTAEVRFGLFLMPFFLVAVLKTFDLHVKRQPRMKIVWGLLISLLIGGYLAQNARAIHQAWTQPDPTFPEKSFRWIATSTPPRSFILGSGPAAITLYTDRFATIEAPARNDEDFRYQLLHQGIHYVLFGPLQFGQNLTQEDPVRFWTLRKKWVLRQSAAYRLLYSNAEEGRDLFEVLPDAAFEKNYRRYLEALDFFDRSAWEEGFRRLDEVLKNDPSFISAYNAYGVGSLLSNQFTDKGLNKLRLAHRRVPDNALILLNLARLEQRSGDISSAKTHFRMALEASAKTGEYSRILTGLPPAL